MLTRQPCGGDSCSLEPPIRDFPGSIRIALSRAAACDGAGLQQLDAGERALLVRLVRNVSAAAPEESVRIANPTLAAGLHVSERTIHRIKAGLEAKGWITRRQVQSRRRGMQISDVWLTQHALKTLGLAKAAIPATLKEIGGSPSLQRPPKVADALLFPQSVSQRQPRGALEFPEIETTALLNIEQNRNENPEYCKTPQDVTKTQSCFHETLAVEETCSQLLDDSPDLQKATLEFPAQEPLIPGVSHVLPEDVRLLANERGVTVAGIRLLMGLATKAGTRLGHVVQAAKDSILKSRKPFAYVKKLLSSGKDWSALALGTQRLAEERQQVRARASDLDQLRAAMAEGLYSHAKRKFVWRVEFGAVHQSTVEDVAQGGIGRWLVLHDVGGLAAAWREGKLFPVTQASIEEWIEPSPA